MNEILSRFCPRVDFDSYEDFFANYSVRVSANFNFAFDVVDEWARIEPDKVALKWTGDGDEVSTFSFEEVSRRSNMAANAFRSFGIGKGDVVMIILKQRPEVWVYMAALEKLGAVCVSASYQLTAKDLEYRLAAAGVKMLVSVDDDELLESIASLGAAGASGGVIRAVVGERVPAGFVDMRSAVRSADACFERGRGAAATRVDEPSLVYFSSGTTGHPKMVLHDHSIALGHIVTAKYWQCVGNNEVHFTQTDSGWAKFAWGKIYGQWICGAAVGVWDTAKFSPAALVAALGRLRPATFCAPAAAFRYLIKEDLEGVDFSYIRHTTVAGEPLSAEVSRRLKEMTGLEVREGFGQSETSVMAAVWKWLAPRPGSMGRPAPLFGIDLLDEDGRPCDDGLVGDISITRAGRNMYEQQSIMRNEEWGMRNEQRTENNEQLAMSNVDNAAATAGRDCSVAGAGGTPHSSFPIPHSSLPIPHSPGLFMGYWKDEELTCRVWKSGVYRTGDMAWRDSDGYYWFVGRNDDVIKCSGYRIGPFEVESALMEHPSVLECAVTAAPDSIRGHVVKATVVLARGWTASEELKKELQNHVKAVTAPYKYPRIVEFAEELPKTTSGKIQRAIIRSQYNTSG